MLIFSYPSQNIFSALIQRCGIYHKVNGESQREWQLMSAVEIIQRQNGCQGENYHSLWPEFDIYNPAQNGKSIRHPAYVLCHVASPVASSG